MSSTVADAAAARLAAVRARIADAAARYGRDAADITLIAVSKTHSAAAVDALAALGQRDFGENYLQEALEKIATLAARPLVWHFIGQLQSNKTRAVAEHFAWAHTIDRAKLADRLSAQRPATLPALLDHVAACPRLQLRGLMAIPPEESSTDAQRRWFAALRTLFEAARVRHPGLDTLSMGMSADLDAAIAEGATQLRIGTALFGPRGATAHAN
jgi:uncharacterized pyridoxal phosphate-containing UPF0001 family protein